MQGQGLRVGEAGGQEASPKSPRGKKLPCALTTPSARPSTPAPHHRPICAPNPPAVSSAMQVHQVYSVPAAFDDLGGADGMLQAMEGLKILQNVMDDCFSRVSSRIAEEKSRLGSLNQRVATAQLKIQAVRGSKTATTVYSTPKYPASDALKLHKPVTSGMPFQEYPVPAEDDKDDDGHRFTPSDNPALLRKDYQDLIALYGRLNPDMSTFSEQLKPGLGKLPHRLESVDSVLLFGTNETPYKQYNVLDALRGQERAARKEEEERRRALFAQPRSMLVGDEGFGYRRNRGVKVLL